MRIAAIEVYQVDLPYAGGVYHLSGGRTYTTFDATIVKLVTEDGTEAWGDVFGKGGRHAGMQPAR